MSAIVVVGCGGLFYHGMAKLAVEVNARPEVESILLVDGDRVEPHNRHRQWGTGVGGRKVVLAQERLQALLGHVEVEGRDERIRTPVEMTQILERLSGMAEDVLLVVSLPDNHKARVDIHEGVAEAHQAVTEIVAGNNVDGGYTYTGSWVSDWTARHPDVVEEAAREREDPRRMEGHSCANDVRQSAFGNMMTALLWTEEVGRVLDGEPLREAYWALEAQENGTRNVRVWYNELERGA